MAAALRPNRVSTYLSDFPYVHAVHSGAVLAMASELLAFNDDMAELPRTSAHPDLPALCRGSGTPGITPIGTAPAP